MNNDKNDASNEFLLLASQTLKKNIQVMDCCYSMKIVAIPKLNSEEDVYGDSVVEVFRDGDL